MRRALWLLPFLAAAPVAAQPVVVRLGTHSGFGRVVFEFAQRQPFTVERSGNAVVLHFPGGGVIPDASGSARNIVAVTGGSDMATVTIPRGARLRTVGIGNRVVIDVLDTGKPAAEAARAAHPAPAATPTGPPAPSVAEASKAVPAAEAASTTQNLADPLQLAPPSPAPALPAVPAVATPSAQPPPAPVTVAAPAVAPAVLPPAVLPPAVLPPVVVPPNTPASPGLGGTLALAAVVDPPPTGTKGSAAMFPFAPGVAAAAFRHGIEAWVIFDDRRPLDLAALADDPVFAGASVTLLPTATLLRFKLSAGRIVVLRRLPDGWSVLAGDTAADGKAVMPLSRPGRLLFPLAAPGQVVVVPDADTGRNLLVGTLKAAGPGVPVTFHVPEFTIDPSWQGVVVEPASDRTVLRPVPEGFAVETGGVLSASLGNEPAQTSAAVLTRRFDFPAEPVAVLLRRLQAQVQDEGQAPPQARLAARKAAAQTMLALGLGAEAQSLLQLAVTEDPRGVADPDVNALAAIAALLSGRPQEAGGLDAPELTGTDEVTFWRAIRTAMKDESSADAAQALATTSGFVLAYPSALRNRLLPIVAETLVAGHATKAGDALLASLPEEPLLAFARATRLQQKGDADAALVIYDALVIGRDRLTSARAATRATELRLATGAMSPAQAADALERSFGDWRGDGRERDLRLRTAAIDAQAGNWRKAFSILKETAELFPDDAPLVNARVTDLLSDMLHGPGAAAVKPLDLVALAEENAAAIAKTDDAEMTNLLADKLMALDLPKRAGPVIAKIVDAAPPGPGKAALGVRLAMLRLSEGDASGAAAALTATDAPDLPPTLQIQRSLADARIHVLAHDSATALAILTRLDTPEADSLRADILGDAGDWHAAELALADVAARTLPPSGALTPEQQDFVLRLASAQSRAGDDAALRSLSAKQGGRMLGARADMLRLLTSGPIAGVADLNRLSGEVALARALPTALAAIGTR